MLRRFLATGALALCVCSAYAALPVVIYSEVASSPTSDVPGVAGAKFDLFDRPYVSENGQNWIIRASSNLATTGDDVIIVGSGVTGTTVIQEGGAAPWEPGANVQFITDRNMSINNAGQYVLGVNTTSTSPVDEQIVWWDGSIFKIAAQGGDAVPGIAGEAYGTILNSPSITNDARIGFRADATVGALPSAEDTFNIFDGAIVAQSGITVPTGAAGAYVTLDSQDYYVSADGSKQFIMGSVVASTTSVVTVNNNVELLEGTDAPGFSGDPISAISEGLMTPGGNWFARGENASDDNWVVMNGNLIAKSGDPIPGGLPGETFDDATFDALFFGMTGNNVGDFVVAGVTSNPDLTRNAVLVVNNSFVLLREGDAVDLDGNGLDDDGVFLSVFNNEDAFLTDDGWYYFTADLVDAGGSGVGQAFMRIQIPEPTSLGLLLVGALALIRRR